MIVGDGMLRVGTKARLQYDLAADGWRIDVRMAQVPTRGSVSQRIE